MWTLKVTVGQCVIMFYMLRWRMQCGTQVPDFLNARVAGEPAVDAIGDETWFRENFTPTVANRGEQVQCTMLVCDDLEIF